MLRFEEKWHGTEARPGNWLRTMRYMEGGSRSMGPRRCRREEGGEVTGP